MTTSNLYKIITPFGKVSTPTVFAVTLGWLFLVLSAWIISSLTGTTHMFPTPAHVATGFVKLWNEGLVTHMASSIGLCIKAIFITVAVSLPIAYLSSLPLMRPLALMLTKFRYLPLTGISFYLGILISDARTLQVWILVAFVSTFLTTGLMAMINEISEEEHYHARSLGHSRWRVLWDVVIVGRLDYVLEIIRQNLAIAWMMLVTVETIVAASGGIGFLIKNSDKFSSHGRIIALQVVILVTGLVLDAAITKARKLIFPYSKI